MSNNWPIPSDLSLIGKETAKLIHQFFVDNDIDHHDGGGRFYSPKEWEERGESYGTSSVLVITHDGGSHAGAFNWDCEREDLREGLQEKLEGIGVYAEQCTSWYSAIHTR